MCRRCHETLALLALLVLLEAPLGSGAPEVVVQPRGIAAGTSHVCSLTHGSGKPVCWGWDSMGQVTTTPNDEVFQSLVAGAKHSCGLRADHTVGCWGSGPITPPVNERFSALASGFWHVCGIREREGTVVCWGNEAYGKTSPPAGERFVALTASSAHSCGLLENRSAVCWGQGSHFWGESQNPAHGEKKAKTVAPTANERFLLVSAGEYHTCGVLEAQRDVRCWGLDHYGQSQAPNIKERFSFVVAGGDHSCALKEKDGSAVCWGLNGDGQATPPAGEKFSSLVAGVYYTCGVRVSDAAVLCWGRTTEGASNPPIGHRAEL